MKVKVTLPALITVTKEINEPRLATAAGIMGVATKPLLVYGCVGLGLSAEQTGLLGSPTEISAIFESKQRRHGRILRGDTRQIVQEMLARLRELHII